MLNPGFDSGAIIETFRKLYREQRRVMVPSLLEADGAARLRADLEDAVVPFYVADRGRYRVSGEHAAEELFSSLARFAEAVVGEPLGPLAHRWLRFAHGDYQLSQGDHVDRPAQGRHLELTLDFSTSETSQGETVYTDGSDHFIVPQLPLSLALVERRDSLYRYDRYFNHLIGDAEVWRLRLSLSFSR